MAKGEQQCRSERAAARHVRLLLVRSRAYRSLWGARVEKITPGEVSQAGVCRVLAEYLWDAGLEPDSRTDLPRVLKDPVSRAFRGLALSPKLLRTIIAAFEFTDEDADHTWALYRGAENPTVITGTLPPPNEIADYQASKFEIIKLQEHHWIGPDGLPTRHRTEINIRSRINGLQGYQYRIDTPHGRVRTVRGGRQGALYEAGGDLWAVDLTFPRPLHRGEMHYMEFWTLLSYEAPPPREMRRGTHERIEHLDMRVEFHPDCMPSAVWWAEWEHYFGPGNRVTRKEMIDLDEELAVDRYLEAVERAVVGFAWEW